jgi:hypothetical protein
MQLKHFVLLSLISIFYTQAQAAISYKVIVTDPQNALAEQKKDILKSLDYAVKEWGQSIDGKGTVIIEINVDPNSSGVQTGPDSFIPVGKKGDLDVYDGSASYKLRTGKSIDPLNPEAPDMTITMNPEFVKSTHWIDPKPTQRKLPVPAHFVDMITLFTHELGHGLGIVSALNKTTQAPDQDFLTVFDSYLSDPNRLAQPIFAGPMTTKVYGEAMPVYFQTQNSSADVVVDGKKYAISYDPGQNLCHYGRFTPGKTDENRKTFLGLMAGSWLWSDEEGIRLHVGILDLAIVSDLGVPVYPKVFENYFSSLKKKKEIKLK